MTAVICVFAVICTASVLVSMKKSGHFVKSLFLSAVEGAAALFAVNAAGTFTGVMLSVNWLTLISGTVFGVAGIAAHLIIQVVVR